MTLVGVCDDCGYADGGHAPTCPRWQTMSEYEILKAQKDAILAKDKARADELDELQATLNAVNVVLSTWEDDQQPIMSLEVASLIGEIRTAIKWPTHARLLNEASQDIQRETKAERDALASVVTRQRSEIDMLRDVPLLAVEWSKLRDQLRDARNDAIAARAAGEQAERERTVALIENMLEGLGEWYSTEAGPALEALLEKVRNNGNG